MREIVNKTFAAEIARTTVSLEHSLSGLGKIHLET